MGVASLLGGLLSGIGSAFAAFFNWKGEQAKTVQSALDVIKSVNDQDGLIAQAHAQALSALMTQGAPIERVWRPILMFVLMGIIISFWFGYVPKHMNDSMSPMMQDVWDLLKIGVGGYIPARTVEKVMTSFNIASVLKTLINKKFA